MARYDLVQKGGQPAVVVASIDAPSKVRNTADYTCDGTGDQTEINLAITAAAAAGGRSLVQLTGGRFYISAAVLMKNGVWLRGSGMLTELRAVGTTGVTGMISLADVHQHLTTVSDMYLEGNYATGGTCSAVRYDNTGASFSGVYPDSNPDPDHHIHSLFIHGFDGVAGRHGVHLAGNNRGCIVHDLQIREIRGYGVNVDGAPDSHFTNIHAGGCDTGGFNIAGGNCKFVSCKAFYCDVGFLVASQRTALSACEAQDNRTDGFRFTAGRTTAVGLIADSNGNPGASGTSASGGDGIVIASSYNSIMGFSAFDRAANASPQAYGVRYTSGDHNQIVGTSQSNGTGDTIGSFVATANFCRISGSAGLTSAG